MTEQVQKTASRRVRPPAVVHLSPAEHMERGKVARAEVPRSSHAGFQPAANRPDPIELLEEQAASRVQELVPIRYGRMLVSPFAFYRGAALIMASDLAGTPRSGLIAQVCGDAHMSNFGVFASPERRLIFDVNDFDETLPGPWEWDVKRLAASVVVAGRERGFSDKERAAAVLAVAEGYRNEMHTLAAVSRPRRVVSTLGRRPADEGSSRPSHRQDGQTQREDPGQGPHPGQHGRLRQAHPYGGWGATHSERPTLDRAAERTASRGRERRVLRAGSTACCAAIAGACQAIGAISSNGSG